MKKFKNSRRSVLRRRMGERLDLYIRMRGIDVGERPSRSAAQPRGSERPRAQARTVAGVVLLWLELLVFSDC
jgi:hypothetical protein